jgi:large subunit ribosomal protein L2
MALIQHRPVTPSQRYRVRSCQLFTKKTPEASLVVSKKRSSGRNCYGRITSRRRGGGHKRLLRLIDFKRNKFDIPAKVIALE